MLQLHLSRYQRCVPTIWRRFGSWGRYLSRRPAQGVDQAEDPCEDGLRQRCLGHLEDSVAAMAHQPGAGFDQPFAQGCQRPSLDGLGRRQRAQEIGEVIRRFRQQIDIPIVLYEFPARTNVSLAPESIAELAEDGTAIGMKFSNYDVPRFARLATLVGDDFALLGGEEPLVACHHLMGARGAVLATANLLPHYWAELFAIAESGDYKRAFRHQNNFQPVLDAVFAPGSATPC